MENPYRNDLMDLFNSLLSFRHDAYRLSKIIKKDIEIYTHPKANIQSSSLLIIADWSNEEKKYRGLPVGDLLKTTKEQYEKRMNDVLSHNLCLYYAQAFERLDGFLKDCLFTKAERDKVFEEWFVKDGKLIRHPFPNKRKLFCSLKRAGGASLKKLSDTNFYGFKYKATWEVFSEVRHAITHSSSVLDISKVTKNKDQSTVFESLFSYEILNKKIKIIFTYSEFDLLIKHVAEFAFQIFKSLSTQDGFSWDPEINKL